MNEQSNGIRTSESILNIAKILSEIQKKIKKVEKANKNKDQNYKYASLENYLEAIEEDLVSNGVSIIGSVAQKTNLDPRPTKSGGTMYVVEVKAVTRLLHESGEWIEIDSYGDGQDSSDKSVYKATTGARKYGLALLFRLVTTDDPEKDPENNPRNNTTNNQRPPQSNAKPPLNNNRPPVNGNGTPPAQTKPPIDKAKMEAEISQLIDGINGSETMEQLQVAWDKSKLKAGEWRNQTALDMFTSAKNNRKTEIQRQMASAQKANTAAKQASTKQ